MGHWKRRTDGSQDRTSVPVNRHRDCSFALERRKSGPRPASVGRPSVARNYARTAQSLGTPRSVYFSVMSNVSAGAQHGFGRIRRLTPLVVKHQGIDRWLAHHGRPSPRAPARGSAARPAADEPAIPRYFRTPAAERRARRPIRPPAISALAPRAASRVARRCRASGPVAPERLHAPVGGADQGMRSDVAHRGMADSSRRGPRSPAESPAASSASTSSTSHASTTVRSSSRLSRALSDANAHSPASISTSANFSPGTRAASASPAAPTPAPRSTASSPERAAVAAASRIASWPTRWPRSGWRIRSLPPRMASSLVSLSASIGPQLMAEPGIHE